MAARAALILSGAGCVLPSVSSGVAVLAECVRHCGFGGDIAFEVHLSSRLYRRVCLRFTPVLAALSPRLPLVHACPRGSIAAFAFGSRLSFFLCQEKRDGLRYAPFLFCRVEIAFVRSRSVGAVICLCGFTSGLCVSLWRSRRVTGVRRTGIRGRWRGLCAFLRSRIGVAALSAGSTLGLRAPNLRQRVECGSGTAASLDSLHAAAGLCWCVFAAFVRFCASALALESFRGEYAGATRPRLRQRVFDSLDSLHAAAGLCWCVYAPPSSGYTERPARL